MRTAIARSPGMASEPAARVAALAAEFVPFAEAAGRGPSLSREARSLAWLFAYRLGDQGVAAVVAHAAMLAWRDAVGDGARQAADEAFPLLADGYARAREDRQRTALQQSLAEALLVTALAPRVLLAVAAGPLDGDGARVLAERVGPMLLRHDARAVVLDLTGLRDPDAAVLNELWAVVHAATMVGARAYVVGAPGLGAQLREAGIDARGASAVETLAAAVDQVARSSGSALVAEGGWFGKAHALLAATAKGLHRG